MNKIEQLIKQQKEVLARRDEAQKEAGEIGEEINRLVVEEILQAGFIGTKWYLQEYNRIYSEHDKQLVMELSPTSKAIQAIARKYNKDYIWMEKGVILRNSMNEYGGYQPFLTFNLDVKVKDFISRYQLKVIDAKIEQEIERLQKTKREWLS